MDERRKALADYLRHVADEVEAGRLEVGGEAPTVSVDHEEWSLNSSASVSAEIRVKQHCWLAPDWFEAFAHAGKHLHGDPRGDTDDDE